MSTLVNTSKIYFHIINPGRAVLFLPCKLNYMKIEGERIAKRGNWNDGKLATK